ncbi:nitrilase-related carbon-nitrogen hydrolase [Candidatus Phytoplasma fraxini]|uniref:Glutamine-dependent NAD(+) synthetase n=1 Tax=Ash yellows phytoplasma TaxID=35780 RepID=A0ABZ2U8Q5_ASHYP
MYKNGYVKIELSSPDLHIGNSFENAKNIIKILNKSKSSFVLFSELCLSGYTAGDLFFETTFLKENLNSLEFIINNTSFQGVYFIGMPFLLKEVLFNAAVVIQNKKILGIILKKTIPNYKEFKEKRWFQSGKNIKTEIINFLGQKVPIGNILFINKEFDIVFGVEICQDLWTIETPSDLLVLNGAHLIFNLSSSTEHVDKDTLRKLAVLDHSRKQIGGYFYTSSGITESSLDNLFSNHKIAAVAGRIIGEKDLTNQDISLVVDVCVDSIKYQRRIDTTYADQIIGKEFPFYKSYFNLNKVECYEFEKSFNTTPFLNEDKTELNKQLKLSNVIQLLSLKTTMSSNPDDKILLEMKNRLNEILTLLVAVQYLKDNKKPLQNLEIIIKEDNYIDDSERLFFAKKLLQNLGINNVTIFRQEMKCFEASFNYELNKLVLVSDNLSDNANGEITYNCQSNSHLYNLNSGIPNTLMVELIIFYFQTKYRFVDENIKNFYLHQIEKFLDQKIIIEDFMLYYHLNNGLSKEKIAFLLEQTFFLNYKESLLLISQYIKNFYKNQYKRNRISPGPKILSCSLSYRTELQLPINIDREDTKLNILIY